MITAYDQPGASGKQLDMAEAVAQMKELLALAEALAKSAEASKATPADTHAQQSINDALNELNQPGALIAAPGPVGVVSADGIQLAADGSLIATAKKGVHFSTLKHFTVAAGRLVSLFAQKGMNLIAATGAVVMQAQRGPMQLAAQEDMTVETVDGVVHVKSPKEIVLNVDGTYLRMTPQGIEMGTRGRIRFRTADLSLSGPAQMDLGGTAFAPQFVPFTTECEVWRRNENFTQKIAPPATAQESAQPEDGGQEGAATGTASAAPDAGTGMAAGDSGATTSEAGAETAENMGTAAPSPVGDFASVGSSIFNHLSPTKIDDPNNAPQSEWTVNPGEYPEPVKMEKAASCNWKMDSFEKKASVERETPRYYKYDQFQTPKLDAHGKPSECSGPAKTTCQFIFDSKTKTLTAKVVIALVPRRLVKLDPVTKQPLHDANGKYIEESYITDVNG